MKSKFSKNELKLDTLFLDRDGVINKKLPNTYVTNFSKFIFIKNSLIAINELSKRFKRILIITNQQGIGKGIMTHEDLTNIHEKMIKEIDKNQGKIAQIYFCPHLMSDYCKCRKPNKGMIEKALVDFPSINLDRSFLVGDSITDIQLAESMGIKAIQVDEEYTLNIWQKDFFSC